MSHGDSLAARDMAGVFQQRIQRPGQRFRKRNFREVSGGTLLSPAGLSSAFADKRRRVAEPDGGWRGQQSRYQNALQSVGVLSGAAAAGPSPMSWMPTTELDLNRHATLLRIVRGSTTNAQRTISPGDFMILDNRPRTKDVAHGGPIIVRALDADGRNQAHVDLRPMRLYNAAEFNFKILRKQMKLKKMRPNDYKRLTPSVLWRGFSLDGVVTSTNELSAVQQQSLFTGDSHRLAQEIVGGRLVAMMSRGPTTMNNVFGMGKLNVGMTLWAVIRKFPVQKKTRFFLSSDNDSPQTPIDVLAPTEGLFMPYQLSFVAVSADTRLPQRYREYRDEDGRLRRDALALKLGRVMSLYGTKSGDRVLEPNEQGPFIDARPRGSGNTLEFHLAKSFTVSPLS